ncbi:MAG: hypothetical protein QT00_C0001G0079 [archaeon GW2011_AR5]|nr:MAG: hypothetical protein QT00_C0001G0079 [archaeon GW2011_AR5]
MEFTPGIYGSWQQVQEQKYKEMKRQLGGLFGEVFSGVILDVGCGFGYLEKTFKGRYIGADNSSEMLHNQVAIFPRVLADGGSLPFKNGSFDSVISIDAMHLIRGDDFKRVLKKGGTAMISIFFNDRNYVERKEMLREKLSGMDILHDFTIHGRENEYVAVARKI